MVQGLARPGRVPGIQVELEAQEVSQSPAVDRLAWQLEQVLHVPVAREYRFHPTRKWRLDLALVAEKIGVEVDGGGFVHGGHNRGAGRRGDLEKDGEALKLGWLTVRCMPEHVNTGQALSWVEAAVKQRKERAA